MTEFRKIIAQNKKALFNYFIEERFEAGIILTGSEVKSTRLGKANIEDSHAVCDNNELLLHNCYIAEYEKASFYNHQTRRPRKLLLHNKEIRKISAKIRIKGYTLIALALYFNSKNFIKIEVGLAKGKKLYDKRETLKNRDWDREAGRLIRDKNK